MKILLVEDEYLIAMAETNALKDYGYEVRHVSSGEKAIEIVKSEGFDLILMDINLENEIDGIETAQIILDKLDIPIIFVSSHIEKEVVKRTEKVTSYGYVVKSSTITVLDASIKMAMKLFNAKKEVEKYAFACRNAEEELAVIVEHLKVKEALNDASLRISGMMVIYDKLYASKNGDYDCIRLDYFMTGLIKQFKDSYFASNGIMITEDIDVIELDIKMTQNIGIIVNELLINIAKYAFPYEEHKKIFISIKAEYNFITICVSDNGIGMPDNFNFDNSEGFGLQLISGLLSSMQGSIRIDREVKGASIIIEFKYKETKNGTSKI